MNGIFTFFIEWNSAWLAAFEPHPILYHRLRDGFGPTVQVMPYAVSDRDGTATLVLPHWHGKDQFGRATLEPAATAEYQPQTVVVETRTIDGLNLAETAFMKITAEGHELAILRGARTKIASDHPNIMVTLQNRLKPRLREDATAWLGDLGFDGFFMRNRELHPMSNFHSDLQRAENAPQPSGSSQAEYIFRFVFIHQSRAEVVDRLRYRATR
jgi:FkbM family methyltransferase